MWTGNEIGYSPPLHSLEMSLVQLVQEGITGIQRGPRPRDSMASMSGHLLVISAWNFCVKARELVCEVYEGCGVREVRVWR